MELTNELQQTLVAAIDQARRRRHEYLTLEHILFAMTEDENALQVLRTLGIDLKALQTDLEQFFAESIDPLPDEAHPQQTPTFKRVLERAARHLQAAERDTIDVANLLAAFYLEPASHAVFLLQKQGAAGSTSWSTPLTASQRPVQPENRPANSGPVTQARTRRTIQNRRKGRSKPFPSNWWRGPAMASWTR